jgi:hypothetical protein
MRLSPPIFLYLADLLLLAPASNAQITDWSPQCFSDSINVTEMMLCVIDNYECFDENSADDIIQCIFESTPEIPSLSDVDMLNHTTIQEAVENFKEFFKDAIAAVDTCLDPYVSCVREEIQDLIDNLNPCINETLVNFAVCAHDNAETCSSTCSVDHLPEENQFEDLTPNDVLTCTGVQDNIMDPTCDIIDCCEACVDEYEEIVRCVLNDILGYPETQDGGGPCVECEARRRALEAKPNVRKPRRHLAKDETFDIYDNCVPLTPGLTGTDATELAARSNFFKCISESFYAELSTGDETDAPTSSPTSSSAGIVLMSRAVLGGLFLVAGMVM